MKRLILIAAMFWVLCGLGAAGFTNAYFARKYDNCKGRQELSVALGMGIIWGPFALLVAIPFSGFGEYGWSLRVIQNPTCTPIRFKEWW